MCPKSQKKKFPLFVLKSFFNAVEVKGFYKAIFELNIMFLIIFHIILKVKVG